MYGKLAWLSILVWICYPVVWLFSTGFASFSVSFEVRWLRQRSRVYRDSGITRMQGLALIRTKTTHWHKHPLHRH